MIFQLPGERGYHVYYQILSGKKPELQGEGQQQMGWESEPTGLGGSWAAQPCPGPHQIRPWATCSPTVLGSVTSLLSWRPRAPSIHPPPSWDFQFLLSPLLLVLGNGPLSTIALAGLSLLLS